jgi:NAD(P)H dehydrogenase (quinone)
MGKILVTGASGDLGRKTLRHLAKKHLVSDLVGLVRDPAKAADLAALGIELRQGDYMDAASLGSALEGVERVMLTSAHAFTDRNTAHSNVIDAAVEAGVRHLVFMSIIRNTDYVMKDITPDDLFAESRLKSSGLGWTVVRHPPFLDNLSFYIGSNPQEKGMQMPVGVGKFAAATRDDLAAGHAAILTEPGHEAKEYALTGSQAVSFQDIANILSAATAHEVPYKTVTDDEYLDLVKSRTGFPDFVAVFALNWVRGMNAGEWQPITNELETLIGRKPTTTSEFYRAEFSKRTEVN